MNFKKIFGKLNFKRGETGIILWNYNGKSKFKLSKEYKKVYHSITQRNLKKKENHVIKNYFSYPLIQYNMK